MILVSLRGMNTERREDQPSQRDLHPGRERIPTVVWDRRGECEGACQPGRDRAIPGEIPAAWHGSPRCPSTARPSQSGRDRASPGETEPFRARPCQSGRDRANQEEPTRSVLLQPQAASLVVWHASPRCPSTAETDHANQGEPTREELVLASPSSFIEQIAVDS